MPIYTYVCEDCGEKFDCLVGVGKDDKELKCKKCGSKNIEQTIASFNVGSSDISSSGSTCPTGTCGLS